MTPDARPVRFWAGLLLAGALLTGAGTGAAELPLGGRAEALFTPGDAIGARVIATLADARQQILVQAYSFTHRAIADALVAARQRGLDVRVIADPEQHARIATSLVADLAERGVPVYLDGQHGAAHDKVMVIDAGSPAATVITGSYNFSHAAEYRNAENLLILRAVPGLAELYADNWHRHQRHAQPLRK